jgi:DNA adenine methylase
VTRYLSPLRYPGGKGRLAPYIASLLTAQRKRPQEYAEPFAGGAGAALTLLYEEHVSGIHINDLSPGIAAFWRGVFEETDRFAARIREVEVSLDEWHRARAIYTAGVAPDPFDLGFATFFLNRCNRSGILTARPIGGLEQTGRWKIDARFNKTDLAERVETIGRFRDRVHLSELDAREFLNRLEPQADDVLVYVDPPYLTQGDSLYLASLTMDDHRELANLLQASSLQWFLTYDADSRITDDLYEGLRCVEFDIAHTAQRQHVGIEYAVYSDRLALTDADVLPGEEGRWISA